ncbi:MAG: cysteine--tRNA ligase [Candidatus Aenigmatarchaeota archaeon]|nr:MAG: cysteine--tRNA ligase [Candidatus Aenigmarchaeota archaeon]
MRLKLFNTLGRKKQVFRPLKDKVVTMYNCGLTVYDYGHIGNFRAFVFADLLRRWLEFKGYRVKQVMNFTDVGHLTIDETLHQAGEDKIELAAKKQRKRPEEIAEFYIKAFLEDSKALNLLEPWKRPRATQHIQEMINLIKKLLKRGYAYIAKSGSVYFEVKKFKQYGKLSGNPIEQLMAGARIEPNPEKKSPYDFALWICDPKHLMQWDAPWGRGYPGWHIECSAMAIKYLGETIDIHTGGEDNIFPHHECEIAQSEAATGKPFARFWLHVRHLLVNGRKMSKSLGNFIILRDLLKQGWDPRAVRLLLESAHYRDQLNFTLSALKQAERNLEKLDNLWTQLKQAKGKPNPKLRKNARKYWKDFCRAMDDDLNTPKALSVIFRLLSDTNRELQAGKVSRGDAKLILNLLEKFGWVFGLEFREKEWLGLKEAPPWLRKLLERRENLRKQRKFEEADRIRSELRKKGIEIEDTKEGPRWRKSSS